MKACFVACCHTQWRTWSSRSLSIALSDHLTFHGGHSCTSDHSEWWSHPQGRSSRGSIARIENLNTTKPAAQMESIRPSDLSWTHVQPLQSLIWSNCPSSSLCPIPAAHTPWRVHYPKQNRPCKLSALRRTWGGKWPHCSMFPSSVDQSHFSNCSSGM